MDAKLREVLPAIEKRLQQEDVESFKIGKATSAKERFDDEEYRGYYYMSVIAVGDKDKINQAERDCIEYFTKKSAIKDKCNNQIGGGGGCPEATELYIAAKQFYRPDENDDNRFDQMLGPKELFGWKIINI